MKTYYRINDLLGWLCFVIAAITYMLTLEPTASFWDCPEFILQAYKLEIGHPPGNPIFMLAGRFFVNFVGGDITKVAYAVNVMSGLLSAATILLLFWTITHLVRKLVVADNATSVSPVQMLVIFGSGICGALAYTWSDTFWFSAVEGEVYAFSSFCTALVFWLILKWENRADEPHSDKYLILIAYVIGISIAVHLLNLLCIPAIGLVIYYKKCARSTAKGSLIALVLSCAVVGLILYGLVPGYIEMSQFFELFFVNTLHWSYNMGVLTYAIILVASFIWAIYELYAQRNPLMIRISTGLSVFLSGITFIGDSLWIAFILSCVWFAYIFMTKKLHIRILNLVVISIFVIFIGYSSYALLLIRSSAHTPMNQNAPDNVFSLASYLNREQYGDRPLFYGQTLNSQPVYEVVGTTTHPIAKEGRALYSKKVKTSPDEPDEYIVTGHKKEYVMTPELNMLFPRIYSGVDKHPQAYRDWIGMQGTPVNATMYVDRDGNPVQQTLQLKPTMAENLRFFLVYQLNHMYWRYFMWNFAGRQNDVQGNGEVHQGNWISGIPFIDNMRLGDQSLLPDDLGRGNKGHNVFYMLPLLMGIIGLGWQAFTSKRGIEQFWVVFFLFFMTGIAIVLYLNQTPIQPRERDYAFAGSFYAYAIWIGMGVAALWRLWLKITHDKKKAAGVPIPAAQEEITDAKLQRKSLVGAIIGCAVGLFIPLQMVSQTWDDHDRSHRYAARDFGMNYLNSLDPNAIIFTNGDNDTFPLWYAQEVEGCRTDVKVVNLAYLTTEWYANQIRRPSYDARPIELQAQPTDYAYDRLQYNYFLDPDTNYVDALASLRRLYNPKSSQNSWGVPVMDYPRVYIPVDTAVAVAKGRIAPHEAAVADEAIYVDLTDDGSGERGASLSKILALDMLATSIENGWDRPVYFAMTVPQTLYLGLTPYMRSTGLTMEVSPIWTDDPNGGVNTDKMYRNVTEQYRWGGLDLVDDPSTIYLDETVRRMVTTHRSALLDLAQALFYEGYDAKTELKRDSLKLLNTELGAQLTDFAADRFAKSRHILDLMQEKMPESAQSYSVQIGQQIANIYTKLNIMTGEESDLQQALSILRREIEKYAQYVVYYQSLKPWQYASLTRYDYYIDQGYFMDLIEDYINLGGDIEELQDYLDGLGVDLDRQVNFANKRKQQPQQQ
ncbi:MAG: DUF2723 domain-containing protein [Bacteroidales bacterium]|nr:DUF2723 domain-containing protein [Bacteroidales bacterium]